jgi:cold shock CspA family protein
MQTGTIALLTERQSGFIRIKGVKEHLFFHADDLVKIAFGTLKKGDKLSFKVVESKNGPYAVEVKKP